MKLVPLHELAQTTSGGTPSRGNKAFYGGDIPWVKSGELPDGEIHSVEETITPLGVENSSAKLLPAGTLLLAMYGATVGKLGILTFPATTNQAVCAITPSDKLDRDYIFHWLLGIRSQLVETSFGGAQPNISQTVIRDLEVPWVPVSEQRQIASRLKTQLAEVETARQAAQAQLRDAALLQHRLLQAAFDHLTCAPTTLGSVLNDIQTGKSFQTAEVLAKSDELGVLKVSAVSWSQFRADQAKSLHGVYKPAENHRVKEGDLLISRANTRELVGAVVLVDRDYPMRLLSDKTLRLVIHESRADKNYLLYALRTKLAREHIELYATGTSDSMRNISQDVIASTPILLPPLDDQRRIVARLKQQLTEADALRTALEQQLRDLDALPQRILAQAFEN
jgi:type I restriction enzyme, S subunit